MRNAIRGSKLRGTLVVGIFLTASLGISSPQVEAAGNQSCVFQDGCVWQGTNATGKFRGFNVNAPNYATLSYSDSSSVANNVRYWQFTNTFYVSFCMYDFAQYIGALNAGNNRNNSNNIAQGSESSRFLIQPAC
jgi:hypothetical protein